MSFDGTVVSVSRVMLRLVLTRNHHTQYSHHCWNLHVVKSSLLQRLNFRLASALDVTMSITRLLMLS